MFRLYIAATLLVAAAGIFCIVTAESTLPLAAGLLLLSLGGGAFSAGLTTRAIR